MPIVEVTMWKGRTVEQKKELAKAITQSMVNIANAKEESIQVIFNDVEKENWAIGGKIKD